MRVVVFGATGVQGAAQVAAASRAGHDVVAVSRSPKPISVDGKQVETAAADFTDAEGIKNALKCADRLLVNLPSTSFHPAPPIFEGATLIGKVSTKTSAMRLCDF
jgi:uncharacterized protein YbjT (DUF2867 family)